MKNNCGKLCWGFLVLLLCIYLSGCAKLAHLQELLVLKGLSDNQTAQTKYIEDQDKKFDRLLAVIKDHQIEKYRRKKDFLKYFGDPIFIKKTTQDGVVLEEWLYRYTRKFVGSKKVYVYFDIKGRFINFRTVEGESNGRNSFSLGDHHG